MLARFRKLTTAGRGDYGNDHSVATGDEETFLLIEDISSINTAPNPTAPDTIVSLRSYVGAADYRYVRIDGADDSTSTNWRINHTDASTYADTGVSRTSATRLWLYVKDGRWAVWSGSDSTPAASGTIPRTLTSASINEIKVGIAGNTGVSTLLMGRFVVGKMTTA